MTDFTQTLKKRIFWMRAFTGTVFAIIMLGLLNRSEERRVGKECL